MKSIGIFMITIFLSTTGLTQTSITQILWTDDCEEVKVGGELQLYIGDDLFNLINGGAELYHEFGFVEVLAAKIDAGGSSVRVEVYDMGSSAAAWGIFSLTATSSAQKLSVGDAGRTGEGFLQFIKDKYMVYAYVDTDINGYHVEAMKCLANNINTATPAPALYQSLNKYKPNYKVVYFQGNLGLSGIYSFHYKDVFGYDEGAANISDDEISIVFSFPDEASCAAQFAASYDFFSESSKYHDQSFKDGSYHLKDRKERNLDFFTYGKYMVIFIHDGTTDKQKDFKFITDLLD